MSMIFEDETAETEAERTRDFSGISSQDPQAESERAFEIEVGQQAAGMRIDSYLTEEIEDAARSYIQRLIEEGRIAVQGRPKTAKNYKLRAGDRIFVRIPPPKKLDVAAEDIPLVMLAAALGVLDSLGLLLSSKKRSKADAADVRIKWPNDILFRQKKLCGILAELVKNGTRTMTVIGIGMNVNAAEVSDAWMQRATSLFIETRAVTDVNELGACIAEHVHERVNMLKQGEKDRILRDYINNCSTLNQEITIHGTDGSKVKAFAEGIDEHGRLIAAFPNGETKTVDAADVSVRTAERMPE